MGSRPRHKTTMQSCTIGSLCLREEWIAGGASLYFHGPIKEQKSKTNFSRRVVYMHFQKCNVSTNVLHFFAVVGVCLDMVHPLLEV